MEASVAEPAELARAGTADSRFSVTPYKHEGKLFVISLVISILFWLTIIVGTFGTALIWGVAIFIGYLFAHSAFISYLKGTGVRLGPDQCPELYERIRSCSEGLGVYPVPEAYLINGEGLLNALATKFLGRNFIVLFSDVVDALERHPQALNFYIGHELGHIKRKHLSLGPILWPASVLPIIGPAYSRASEYTCDAYGQACCEKAADAAIGLAVLAAGPSQWKKLDVKSYAAQSADTRGFWMSFHELVGDYPWLVKRMEHVKARATRSQPAIPRRSVLAWLFAFFVPRVGVGGDAAGMMVMVAIIGILAAIAVPQFNDYRIRAAQAESKAAFDEADAITGKIADYIVANGKYPESLAEVGVQPGYSSATIGSVRLTDAGVEFTLAGNSLKGRTFVYSPFVDEGRLYWDCSGGSLKPELRPEACQPK
jgi:Zn-dependent protease with chaperone function